MDQTNRRPIAIIYLIIAISGVILFQDWWIASHTIKRVPYSEVEKYLEKGVVKSLIVRGDEITGWFKQPDEDDFTEFRAHRVDPALAAVLDKYPDVEYGAQPVGNWLTNIIGWIAPALIFVAIWMFLSRRLSQGLGPMVALGKSKARVFVETDTKVTFDDVAGLDEAKEELAEIVSFLKNRDAAKRLGARLPKGILLVGPPGTGKTLIARAIAGESGVPFYSINGSEFVEMFVGVGAARVRDLFEQASKTAPCIIFIDELDALGRARGLSPMGGHDEKEQTLNQLLVEMDGFDTNLGVILLAATNRPEILDPALLRAGRFDRQVLIDRPDKNGRKQILAVHCRHLVLADDVDIDEIASFTTGFSGADLANLANEAAILATKRGRDNVTQVDLIDALERIVAGFERKSRILKDSERRIIAYHECGHALVALALPDMDPVHKITIIPRGIGALGYTMQRPSEDSYLSTKTQLEHRIAVLLGGRTAERLVFGEVSTGAADDLQRATAIASDMVTRYAMTDKLGDVVYSERRSSFLDTGSTAEVDASESTRLVVENETSAIIGRAAALAAEILTSNREQLETTAKRLLERETLQAADLPVLPKWHAEDRAALGSARA